MKKTKWKNKLSIWSEKMEAETLRINDIVRLPELQVRLKEEEQFVTRYMFAYLNGNELPPVKVVNNDGAWILVDGWHRIAALERISRETVKAVIVKGTYDDAVVMAAMINLTNGLPLKSLEIRKAFRVYMHYKQNIKRNRYGQAFTPTVYKSYREIAMDLQGVCSHVTIRNWMKVDFPTTFATLEATTKEPSKECLEEDKEFPEGEIRFFISAKNSLYDCSAAFKGVKDPKHRGEIIYHAEQIVAQMKKGGKYAPYQVSTDF